MVGGFYESDPRVVPSIFNNFLECGCELYTHPLPDVFSNGCRSGMLYCARCCLFRFTFATVNCGRCTTIRTRSLKLPPELLSVTTKSMLAHASDTAYLHHVFSKSFFALSLALIFVSGYPATCLWSACFISIILFDFCHVLFTSN